MLLIYPSGFGRVGGLLRAGWIAVGEVTVLLDIGMVGISGNNAWLARLAGLLRLRAGISQISAIPSFPLSSARLRLMLVLS